MRTTQPPRLRVTDIFPELAGHARTTVRLHPRLEAEPAPDASKLGGRMLWPAGEPWPRCDLAHARWLSFPVFVGPDHRPYVPVLQLRKADVPELDFPAGTDVFQLLWCPADHADPLYVAAVRISWWDHTTLVDTVVPPPVDNGAGSRLIPRPCALHPERVEEYPHVWALPESLSEAIQTWEAQHGQGPAEYQFALSAAPGTKVGGHPFWYQEPDPQTCDAGHDMDHLVTISDVEFDGGTWPRWLAVEEDDAWDGPTDRRFEIQAAVGIELGMGAIYVFICRICPERPIRQVFQR